MGIPASVLTTTLVGSLLLLSGCGSPMLENTWKSTKGFYGSYINPPASIDYEDKGSISDAEMKLATRMVGIDMQLEALERYLQNADRPPSAEAVAVVMQRFPWLSGLAAVDNEGMVLAQEPPFPMKPLEFVPLLTQESRDGSLRGLRGYVQDTPLGAEVFAYVPVYQNMDRVGLFVTHFDMRSLLTYTNSAEDLVVLSPQGVLWSGHFMLEDTPLAGQDWAKITQSSVRGTLSNDRGEFIWLARFIGTQPLIFATPVQGHFAEHGEAMKNVLQTPFQNGQVPNTPVTEEHVIEESDTSLLLAPLPPIKDLGIEEQPVSH